MASWQKQVFFGIFFFLAIPLTPALATPQLDIESLPKRATADQKFFWRVTLSWPSTEGSYEMSASEPQTENLTLLQQSQSLDAGTEIRHIFLYSFQPITKGEARIHRFEIRYRQSDSESWKTLWVPEQNLRIFPPSPFKNWLVGLISFSGIFVLMSTRFFVWKRAQKNTLKRNLIPADPKQAIYKESQEAMISFSSEDPKEKLGQWSSQFTKVLRTYYDIPDSQTTETNLLDFLRNKPIAHGEWNEISRLFSDLNRLKFAQDTSSFQEIAQMQKTLLKYIQGKIIIENSNS